MQWHAPEPEPTSTAACLLLGLSCGLCLRSKFRRRPATRMNAAGSRADFRLCAICCCIPGPTDSPRAPGPHIQHHSEDPGTPRAGEGTATANGVPRRSISDQVQPCRGPIAVRLQHRHVSSEQNCAAVLILETCAHMHVTWVPNQSRSGNRQTCSSECRMLRSQIGSNPLRQAFQPPMQAPHTDTRYQQQQKACCSCRVRGPASISRRRRTAC